MLHEENAMFDRFDIVSAHYWFGNDWHGGGGSPEYARLCRCARIYRPSPIENGPPTENAGAIYRNLVRKLCRSRRSRGLKT